MPSTTRPATSQDVEFLTDMLVEAVNWRSDRDPISRDEVFSTPRTARYVADWPRQGELGVVALDRSGQPIGAAWLRLFNRDEPGYGFVTPDVPELSMGVITSWRGKGIGRALLREVTDAAAQAGLRQVSLSVEHGNFAASLYRSEGFSTFASGQNADTMIKDLITRR